MRPSIAGKVGLKPMRFLSDTPLFDLHNHTLASGHAYGTIRESAEAAADRGLAVLGFSEHAWTVTGAPSRSYFLNFKEIPSRICGVRIVNGIEANILNESGEIDVDEQLGSRLDFVIASLHPSPYYSGPIAKKEIIRAYIETMRRNPFVRIIGHPEDGRFPVDYRSLAEAASDRGVALELNNSGLREKHGRQNGAANAEELLEECARCGAFVVMGSDSHWGGDAGALANCETLVEQTGFPKQLVLNYRSDGLAFILREPLEE